jgi:hypothetical protein
MKTKITHSFFVIPEERVKVAITHWHWCCIWNSEELNVMGLYEVLRAVIMEVQWYVVW